MWKTGSDTTSHSDGSVGDDSDQEHVMKAKTLFVLTLPGLAVC
jgi:hypothetical protein